MNSRPHFLLDTNTCIYIAKRRPLSVLIRFESLQVGEVAMSMITVGELRYGPEKSRDPEQVLAQLLRLSELIPVLPLTERVADGYGLIRATLERAGTPIGGNDF
jgi:tRNA(fMet)-specific endonuclease VapC